jgi:alpha-2-macroglobulin
MKAGALVVCLVVSLLSAESPRDAIAATSDAAAKPVSIRTFSPQGEVAKVRQARATFSDSMVDFGDAKLGAPFDIQCEEPGSGRWVDDKTWVYDFKDDLGPGVRCNFKLKNDIKSRNGARVSGKATFDFSTGGPSIVRVFPVAGKDTGATIDEEQAFVLLLNGPATAASVKAYAWCEISGIGERVPVRMIEGADQNAFLERFQLTNRHDRVMTLACTRRLPNDADLTLVWGKGIATLSGVTTSDVRRLDFKVRSDFTASFTCERENAQAACIPVRPIEIDLTAPITRAMADRFVLRYVDNAKTIERHPDRTDPSSDDAKSATVQQIVFQPPFGENAAITIEAPKDLTDDAGRHLSNASLFPLQSKTALAPPLAKFAASPFGILELEAEPVLPLTVRHVEAALAIKRASPPTSTPPTSTTPIVDTSPQGTVRTVAVAADNSDADIIEWQRRVKHYHESSLLKSTIDAADLPADAKKPAPDRPRVGANQRNERQEERAEYREDNTIATRELSLLKRDPNAKAVVLPPAQNGDPRPFEVIGIPLPEPGFHVIEIESQRLGAALLGKPAPMYVRTTALVTNLAVHAKFGRVNSGVWVTSLDRATPVAGASVRISDCLGTQQWEGTTDARGFVFVPRAFPTDTLYRICSRGDDGGREVGYFVSARKAIAVGPNQGKTDMAFVWSNWTEGIESWRFNLPSARGGAYASDGGDSDGEPVPATLIAHTVFDRTLFRAGQTVSMKHYARRQNLVSLSLADANSLPTTVTITHVGSGQKFTYDLAWRGNRYAETIFKIPDDAKLGEYQVTLQRAYAAIETGSFRVEEFRLPVFRGSIALHGNDGKTSHDFVRPASLTAQVAVAFSNGGAASSLPIRVSAATETHRGSFPGYDGFAFERSGRYQGESDNEEFDDFVEDGPSASRGSPGQKIVADKLAATLDRNGEARVDLKSLPASAVPRDLHVEATYADPNGEIQTLSQTVSLWPSAIVVGIKSDSWVSVQHKAAVKLLALDLNGKPLANVALEVRGVFHEVRSIRKRMVGGFYAYDNQTQTRELGKLCSGISDARGLVLCDVAITEPGNVELVASAKDAPGNVAEASASVWVTRKEQVWFGGENQDRIDVLPEKNAYAPGEVAKFQVRMPFRAATALVAIERDGIMATQVVEIRGDDPTVSIKVEADWAPNVFVSVLAVRGRIREVPWYSFFTWGWKAPTDWWHAWRDEGKLYEPPTAMVDLGKPAFKYGIATIHVDKAAHQLKVAVTTDKPDYPIRATARATVHVTQPDGKPLPAGTEVAVAAVDEALLELMPNASWNLLDAMILERGYAIETATAQMQIIGKRHYGRKAAPPGGGGGGGPSRELFDTLLLWKPSVVLDANGNATVDVPLNDSLTSFRIVAVADAGTAQFGTGSATIRSRQDLQVVSGLPPLVREGDRYQAMVTVRNTTKGPMDVAVDATSTATDASPIKLPTQQVHLEADSSRVIEWPIVAPSMSAGPKNEIAWQIVAKSTNVGDSLKISQRLTFAIPVTVQQATLTQVDKTFSMPVAAPSGALSDAGGALRGGLSLALRPSLSDGLPGVRAWFDWYPYGCLEQRASIAIGTMNEAQWDAVARSIPLYLDNDGLASYFPPRAGDLAVGSDVLTAYLLTASAEASALGHYAIPDETRAKMESGLIAFVEGRIRRQLWSPFGTDGQRQLDVRKLAAIEALTRTGKATPRMLQSLQILPNQWPTSAVIDWMLILKRVQAVPDHDKRLAEADQILRARLNYQGTRLDFSTEKDDFWYWLMASGDGNASRLVTAVLDDPAWKDDVPRLVIGSLQRQRQGHWLTTTANVWGTLAVNEFSKRFEKDPVTGTARASVSGATPLSLSWSDKPQGSTLMLSWPKADAKAGVKVDAKNDAATRRDLQVTQEGSGKPWLTVQSLAAVPLTQPFTSGYRITRTITPIEQKTKGVWSRGDVLRIKLEIDAQTDMTWVVVSDPIPGGASILGTGLGRDSQLASSGEQRQGWVWPAYEEKSFEAYRSYYGYVPKGKFSTEYTVRLNNVGKFGLPPTHVEAMYAPEMYGEVPNAMLEVQP